MILKRKKSEYSCLLLACLFFSFCMCKPPAHLRKYGYYSGDGRQSVVRSAKRYIGVKYRYGGADPRGFDCSGYTSYIYKINGMSIPRTASKQFEAGRRIGIRRARPGDLVFFKINGWSVSHVGIYMGRYVFAHAPRSGRTVSYDDIRKKYWRKRYAGTVTYFR